MSFLEWMRARHEAQDVKRVEARLERRVRSDLALHQPDRYNDIPEGDGAYYDEFFPLDTRDTFEGEDRFQDLDRYEPRGRQDTVLYPQELKFTDDPGTDYSEYGFSPVENPKGFEDVEAGYGQSLMDLQSLRPSSVLDSSEGDIGQNPSSVRSPSPKTLSASIRVSARQRMQEAESFNAED